jgi:hypothetical protein
MSSGEKAKPPATFEERNPFDISRNSGPEVAAEIAKRMAAWKQARARTSPAPTTNRSSTKQSGTIPSGDPKQSPIAAPVQPARMPKAARESQPAQTPTGSAGSAAPPARAPYFAVSATRRAMPPAPSPKQARPTESRGDGRAARTDEPAIMPSAPAREHAPRDHDEQPLQVAAAAILATTPEPPVAESSPADATAVEEAPLEAYAASAPTQPEPSDPHPFGSASAAEASEPTPPEPTETERRRAEARALKARWIAARDLDTLLERPAASGAADIAQSVEAAETASPDAGIASARDPGTDDDAGPLVHEPHGVEEDFVRWSPEESDTASEPDIAFEAAARGDEPAHPAMPTAGPEATAVQTSPMAARGETAGRQEPTFDAPKAPAPETASVADLDAEREPQALDIAALDEIAGRREPTFDAPVARTVTLDAAPEASAEAPDEMVAPQRAEPAAAGASDLTAASRDATDDQRALSIAALDAVAGRKEPTFDQPVQPVASDGAATDAATEAPAPIAPAEPAPTLSAPVEAATEPPARGINALEKVAGRKEPHFDEPVRPAVAAPAAQKAHIKLRPIETRIEARRVDTLRADPPLTARRPIFPHIEPDEWDVPPMVAAHAGGERRGTGWAIGLGSLLLIAGITAPAAIWQQGRQVQDQVALVSPAPAPQQTQATSGSPATDTTTAQAPTQPSTQATWSAAPQPEASRSKATAPAVAAQQSSAPAPVEPKPVAPESGTADESPTTTLGAIGNSDDVNEAPVVAPPSPIENLKTASTGTPMVARPFEPEQGDGPFLRVPTTGAATVPVTGAPSQPAAVGVKPNLIGQLKPRAAAVASASTPVVSKPRTVQRQPKPFFQQSPDQMFETLIETLSEGRPVNPNTKPASPTNRR